MRGEMSIATAHGRGLALNVAGDSIRAVGLVCASSVWIRSRTEHRVSSRAASLRELAGCDSGPW